MASHPHDQRQEELEFVPYEPSLMYPAFLAATSTYYSFIPHVETKVHQVHQTHDEVKNHFVTRWLSTQEHKLQCDKDLRSAAYAGSAVFVTLLLTKKKPFLIAPLIGGAGAWFAGLAMFKPQVLTESLKDAYGWVHDQTRYFKK